MERKDGHYYVRYGGKWDIARYSQGYGWKTFDWSGYHKDDAFDKINEQRIEQRVERLSPEELAIKTEELRISQRMGDRINDIDDFIHRQHESI